MLYVLLYISLKIFKGRYFCMSVDKRHYVICVFLHFADLAYFVLAIVQRGYLTPR